MKNILKYILILIIFIIIFIILYFYKSKKNIFEDITILGLWNDLGAKNEYEIIPQNTVEIDVFKTINKKRYKKIAPGSSGSFTINFKRPLNLNYKINIIENASKPKNLVFSIENKKYTTLEEMENVINKKFIDTDKITINWEWKYYTDENNDIQDTKDGQNAQIYIFKINAIVEDWERTEIWNWKK